MKILLAGPFGQSVADEFRVLLPAHEILAVKTQDEYDSAEDCEVIVTRVLKSTAKTMGNKKNLKSLIRWGVGYDTVDIKAAGEQGVVVANTPGVNAYAVSELAAGLMISVGRCISVHNQLTHEGIWNNKLHADKMTSLNHKIVGIIGGGNIGRRVARHVQSFGSQVLYYDVFRLSEETERECGMVFTPLPELLGLSDVVSLHLPLLDSTYHIIGKEELALMKDSAIIINTARGGLIDDAQLIQALQSGKLAGAGLDCLENENLAENPLASMENVIITPHMGGTSNDLPSEMVPVIAAQIKKFSETGTLDHIVNKEFLQD